MYYPNVSAQNDSTTRFLLGLYHRARRYTGVEAKPPTASLLGSPADTQPKPFEIERGV